MFLEISQNSQENTCALVLVSGLSPATLLKKRFWHKRIPVNFAKFLRTPFFIEHLWWLLLLALTSLKISGKIFLLVYQLYEKILLFVIFSVAG